MRKLLLVSIPLVWSCSRVPEGRPAPKRTQPYQTAEAEKPVPLRVVGMPAVAADGAGGEATAVAAGGELVEWRIADERSLFVRFAPTSGKWTSEKVAMPDDVQPFAGGGSQDRFGEAFGFDGGVARPVECRSESDVALLVIYRPGEKRWQVPPPFVTLKGRRNAAFLAGGGRLWVLGGEACEGGKSLSDGAVFDPETNVWAEVPPLPGTRGPRRGETFWVGGRLVAVTDVLYVYDERLQAWGPALATKPGRLFAAGSQLVVFGADESHWRFSPVTGLWAKLSATGAPRAVKTAVWSGTYLVVQGAGVNLYDPAADKWLNPQPTKTPEAKDGTVGAWIGQEAIFWSPKATAGFRVSWN